MFSFPSSANVQYIPESFQYGIGNNGLYKYNPQTNNYVLLKSLAPKTNYVLKHFQGRILAYGWTTKTININLNSNNIATTASDYQAYIFSDNPNNFTTLDQFSDTALGSGLNFYTSPLMTKLGTGYNQPNNTFFIQARSIDYLRGLSTTLSIQNL